MAENQLFQQLNQPINRILGKYPPIHQEGNTLLITAGIHGNEPSGIIAFQKVWDTIHEKKPTLNGNLIGLAGNLSAIKAGERLVDHDLNRLFTSETLRNIDNKTTNLQEEKDVEEIVKIVKELEEKSSQNPLYYLDLHTTSSPTSPFISVKNGDESISFAQKFHLPLVIGIEKYIPGNFDLFMASKGHLGFTVEAGQHAAEKAVKYHETVIWKALFQTGILQENEISLVDDNFQLLNNFPQDQPNYEVIFKYEIHSGEKFTMEEGYSNFQAIKKGEILAYSDGRPVVSKWDGFIFMPLYQSQGKDGFFVVMQK